MKPSRRLLGSAPVIASVFLLATCFSEDGARPGVPIPVGSWGGENAGAFVDDTTIHLHVGCTYGDAPRPTVSADGGFSVDGEYNVDAHPVDLGQFHPARFHGSWYGGALRVTVEVREVDITLGPAQLYLGRDPELGPCPICRPPSP